MTRTLHLMIGAPEHGVVRHGVLVAQACGDELIRVPDAAAALEVDLDRAEVVHIPVTDRLFAATCEQALAQFLRVAQHVRNAGAELSITLHDVPVGTSAWSVRRRAAYEAMIAVSRGVVVNSRVELAAVETAAAGAHSLQMIALPVEAVQRPPRESGGTDAVVLGFVFPDRGHEAVLRAVPAGSGLVALGQPSDGHEHLPAQFAELAAELDRRWRCTGFVPDADLAGHLARAGVPIAPNTRVTASGSIATWLAHGRRPLVPAIDYTRELLERMPGSLWLYDPDDPAAIASAIADALADPDRTWLPDAVELSPSTGDVARRYRRHLDSCAPPSAVRASSGMVPHNRWDLVAIGGGRATVSVVVPYYDAQAQLDLVLTALRLQRFPLQDMEIVVADDGSPTAPELTAAGPVAARTVRQEHRGFGAARARNLGAHAATGDVLVFLDGDTVPEPDFVARIVRLPVADPAAVCVGRRRHADLGGWGAAELEAWLTGRSVAPVELTEPRWLRDGYRDSRNLLDADARSYRYVISAVLAMNRALFDRSGGFDERFTDYGGEDWEFAHRAWLAGALLAHVPEAVAWHDGPDFALRNRADATGAKNRETLTLSTLLPDPSLRGPGQWFPYCQAIVMVESLDSVEVLATARSAFAAGVDCGFWLVGAGASATVDRLADPRIRAGQPPQDVRARASAVVALHAPADLSVLGEVVELAVRHGIVRTPALTVRATRALSRCGTDDQLVEVLYGAHDRSRPLPAGQLDLAASLRRAQ